MTTPLTLWPHVQLQGLVPFAPRIAFMLCCSTMLPDSSSSRSPSSLQDQRPSRQSRMATLDGSGGSVSGDGCGSHAKLLELEQRIARLEQWFLLMAFLVTLGIAVALGKSWPPSSEAASKVEPETASLPAVPIRLIVQKTRVSGFKLPKGETYDSLVDFVQDHSRLRCNASLQEGPAVYVSIATPNRFEEELVNQTQVKEAGRIDWFLFIWITGEDRCKDDPLHQKIQKFVRDRLDGEALVAFLCWWDGFILNNFTADSMRRIEETTLGLGST
eukprot:gb/GFBE01021009.1/.p1 GENE.gb/GFBE01021009.1/~~gb/GFBE01021009.1/.p1  ORF type:complete len:273 (+),score=38.75 gb/GFBE01021009.1/:1-819(+)